MNASQLEHVVAALRSCAVPVATEAKLQAVIADALSAAGVTFEREAQLGELGRIDFLCEDGIGIEVKIGGSRNDVIRQLHDYAQHPSIRALVLFTTRSGHAFGADVMNGKPIITIRSAGWL